MSVEAVSITNIDFYQCLLDNLDDGAFFVDQQGTVTHWSRSAEQLTGHLADDVVGKSCNQFSLLHIGSDGLCDGPDACPVSLVLADGHRREADVFFRHRQGHLVPVHVRVVPLRDQAGQVAGVVEIISDYSARDAAHAQRETLRQNSLLDPLTETASRRHLELRIEAKLEEARRYGWQFGVVAAVIDDFDDIRQDHSRRTTDELVKMAAKTFAYIIRTYDAIGRWGEDDFLAIMSIKDPQDLHAIAERVRSLVEQTSLTVDDEPVGVTLSIGVTAGSVDDTVESLVERAHEGLTKSLQAGGNVVH